MRWFAQRVSYFCLLFLLWKSCTLRLAFANLSYLLLYLPPPHIYSRPRQTILKEANTFNISTLHLTERVFDNHYPTRTTLPIPSPRSLLFCRPEHLHNDHRMVSRLLLGLWPTDTGRSILLPVLQACRTGPCHFRSPTVFDDERSYNTVLPIRHVCLFIMERNSSLVTFLLPYLPFIATKQLVPQLHCVGSIPERITRLCELFRPGPWFETTNDLITLSNVSASFDLHSSLSCPRCKLKKFTICIFDFGYVFCLYMPWKACLPFFFFLSSLNSFWVYVCGGPWETIYPPWLMYWIVPSY